MQTDTNPAHRLRLVHLRAQGYSWADIKGGKLSQVQTADIDLSEPDEVLEAECDDALESLASASSTSRLSIERQRVLVALEAIYQEAWRIHREHEDDPRTLRLVLDTVKERISLLGLRAPAQLPTDTELSGRQLALVWLPPKDMPDQPGLVPTITMGGREI